MDKKKERVSMKTRSDCTLLHYLFSEDELTSKPWFL